MQITWLGHSAFRVEFADTIIMIDPFLSGSPTFDGDPLEAAAGCTHVALTHGHDDHVGDALAILKATGAQLISNYEIYVWLNGQGVENCNPANPGGTISCGGFTTTFTHANHSSGTVVDGQSIYLGAPCGLVFEAESEPTLYHMGDTNMFGDMALIEDFQAPKVGIVPIGDRFTMGAKQAAIACQRYFNFETIIPCHYGTFPVIDQSADAFVKAMGSAADKVRVPEIGVPFTV